MHTPFPAGSNSRHQGRTPVVSGNDSALSTQVLLVYKTTHRCGIATHRQTLSEMTWLRGTELFGEFWVCSPSFNQRVKQGRIESFKKWCLFADNTVRVWTLGLWTKDSCLYFPEAEIKGCKVLRSWVWCHPSIRKMKGS